MSRLHLAVVLGAIVALVGCSRLEQQTSSAPTTGAPRASVSPAVQKQIDATVSAYLRMQRALAKDDTAAI